jgi:hypothetical protein
MTNRRYSSVSRKERKRFRIYVGIVVAVGALIISAVVTWIKYQKNSHLFDEKTIQLNDATPTNMSVEVTGNDTTTNSLTPMSQGEGPN